MKILLDEGVPKVIKRRLVSFEISTVEEMGWRGIRNSALLDLMVGRFDVLVTADRNLPYQQNLIKRQLSAVILPSNQIPLVIKLLAEIESAIREAVPGESTEIPMPSP